MKKNKGTKAMIAALVVGLIAGLLPVSGSSAAVSGASKLKHNSRFNGAVKEYGIDVSKWQGDDINWKKVKNAGIQFAMIRVAYRTLDTGDLMKDPYADRNMKGASENGIPFGVYIFSQALTVAEARQEADYILKVIEGYDVTLPVALDYEYGGGRLTTTKPFKQVKIDICHAFCKRVEQAGYTPMVYANKNFLENSVNAASISQYYPIWLAHYTNQTAYAGDYEYWQYTSSGQVDGIKGNVDMNVRYVNDTTRVNDLRITEAAAGKLGLMWSPFEGAVGYEISRRTANTDFEVIATLEGQAALSFTDMGLAADTAYMYKVRAVLGEAYYSGYSATVTGYSEIKQKPGVTALGTAFDTVKVSWRAMEAAEGYEVWKYNASKKVYELIKSIAGGNVTSYTDTQLLASTTYSYKVRAYRTVRTSKIYSPFSAAVKGKTKTAAKGKVTASSLKVRASASTAGKVLKTVKKGTLLTIKGSTGNWYRTSVTVNGKKRDAYVSKSYVSLVKVGTPTGKQGATSFDKIKLTWSKVSGAKGYVLQRYNSSKKAYETIKTITGGSTVSYKDVDLNAATTYQYRIRAYKVVSGKTVYGEYSQVFPARTKDAVNGTTTAKVSLRKSAKTSASVLKTVKKGTKVTVTGSRGSFYRLSVTVNGKKQTAYVQKAYVKL